MMNHMSLQLESHFRQHFIPYLISSVTTDQRSQFINEHSWLLFEYGCSYRHLSHPCDDPDTAAAPIVTDELAWLLEHPATWDDYDEYICLRNWVSEIQ